MWLQYEGHSPQCINENGELDDCPNLSSTSDYGMVMMTTMSMSMSMMVIKDNDNDDDDVGDDDDDFYHDDG